MAKFRNHYACTECGQHWIDEWSCACDDRCSNCNTSISPYFYEELQEEAETEEETEEEHAVRLRRISDEVKADMKAGRYRHGQLRPEISAKNQLTTSRGFQSWQSELMDRMMSMETMTGRFTRPMPSFSEMYGGRIIDTLILDEAHSFKKMHMSDWGPYEPEDKGQEKDGPKTTYWTQPIPNPQAAKPVSSPSEELRAKRRAKRRKKK